MRAVFQKILDENAQRYALHASAFAGEKSSARRRNAIFRGITLRCPVQNHLSVFWLGFSPLYWPDMENFANP